MDSAHTRPLRPEPASSRGDLSTRLNGRFTSAVLVATVVVVTSCLVLGVLRQWTLAYLVAAGIAVVVSVARPRAALLLIFALPILFREETWQLQYWPAEFGGTTAPVVTIHSMSFAGITAATLLIGVLMLRSLFPGAVDRRLTMGDFEGWLALFAAMALLAEVVGRLTTAYSGPVFGQWSQIALPVIVGLLLPLWCGRRELVRGVDMLAVLVAARFVFGLSRFFLGGGEYNIGAARRSVFWDSADGFLGVFAVTLGSAWLVDRSAGRWRRLAGAGMVVAGLLVIALSYRRQAMVSVVVAAPLTLILLRSWTALWVTVGCVGATLLVLFLVNPAFLTESAIGQRAASVVATPVGMADTNEWHLADIRDAWRNIQENPVLGYGFHAAPPRRTYELSARDASLEVIGVYHNLVLNVWFRMGIVGLVALLGLLWCGLRAGVRAAWVRGDALAAPITAALVGVVVSGATAPILVSYRLPFFLLGGLSALVIIDRDRSHAEAESEPR